MAEVSRNDKKLNGAGLVTLWGIIKEYVNGAVEALSTVYAAVSHSHTKSDISDLADATDSAGGLMTAAQAQKLAGIAAGAEKNAINGIQKNGTDVAPDGTTKKVNIVVPTKTSDLTNDDNTVKDASYVHTDNNYSSADKEKLGGIENGAEANVIEQVKVNGTAVAVTGKAVNITVPTDNASLANGAGYQTADQVNALIESKVSSTYKPQGSVAFASLPSPAKASLGHVYNVTDSFTTTSSFVEGAGKQYPAGSNVAVVEAGSGTYKWDVLAGFVDLSGYASTDDVETLTTAEIQAICS